MIMIGYFRIKINFREKTVKERFLIYCDESVEKGRYYSHFYGGALIKWRDRERISNLLQEKKTSLNLHGEVKWTKITTNYLQKYIDFIDYFFDFVADGSIKIRIMFSQNANEKPDFSEYQIDNEYFLLYYQFIKHAFGLRYWNHENIPDATSEVVLYIDDPPQNAQKFDQFRNHLSSLSEYSVFRTAGVKFEKSEITGVSSHDHVIMQGLDIILGAIQSRLNEVHTKPIPPAKRRSKKAKAKAQVYKKIKERVCEIYPNFNFGVSTGSQSLESRFKHHYRHWNFVSSGSTLDRSRAKSKRKKM